MNWNEMTYDQQRAALGLADVRAQVAWTRLTLQARRFGEALADLGRLWRGEK